MAKHYFVSDVHLGLLDGGSGRWVSSEFVKLIKSIASGDSLYLLGDIFDFWVDYKYIIPVGYTRVLGAMAEATDRGVNIHFYRGNHDYWTKGYLHRELGVIEHLNQPEVVEIEGKRFCLAHGDGLNDKRLGPKVINLLFKSKICIALLRLLHPHVFFPFAYSWSRYNREKHSKSLYLFKGKDDNLYGFAQKFGEGKGIDYFIFGHIHSPANIGVDGGGELYVLGDWIDNPDYLVFDGTKIVRNTISPY
jgi:UDP-2,3-diacylglucosamine hydrolase